MNAEVVWNNSSLKKKKHSEYEQKDVYLNSSVRMTYIHLFCFVCELFLRSAPNVPNYRHANTLPPKHTVGK